MKTAERLTQRLRLVYRWYEGMVNPDTGMFEYLYLLRTDAFVREKSPIRDIASVWDAELLHDKPAALDEMISVRAEELEQQVEEGHVLLFVRVLDTAHEEEAVRILAYPHRRWRLGEAVWVWFMSLFQYGRTISSGARMRLMFICETGVNTGPEKYDVLGMR